MKVGLLLSIAAHLVIICEMQSESERLGAWSKSVYRNSSMHAALPQSLLRLTCWVPSPASLPMLKTIWMLTFLLAKVFRDLGQCILKVGGSTGSLSKRQRRHVWESISSPCVYMRLHCVLALQINGKQGAKCYTQKPCHRFIIIKRPHIPLQTSISYFHN